MEDCSKAFAMRKLWIIAMAAAFISLPGAVRAQQSAAVRDNGKAAPSVENSTGTHTYPGRPVMRNRQTGHRGSPIYSGSGFGPNYNPNGMSGLNANGNTGVASGPGLGAVTPGWQVRKNH